MKKKEWGDPPITKSAFEPIVKQVMDSPDETKDLERKRKAYWKGDVVVIYDPNSNDKGTCFKPTTGKDYYDKLT